VTKYHAHVDTLINCLLVVYPYFKHLFRSNNLIYVLYDPRKRYKFWKILKDY